MYTYCGWGSVCAGVCVRAMCCVYVYEYSFLKIYKVHVHIHLQAQVYMWMLVVTFGGLFNHACSESYLVI